MTIPDYDKECDCEVCELDRQQRKEANQKRIKEEIQRVLRGSQKKR
jgi:hypothetical protein